MVGQEADSDAAVCRAGEARLCVCENGSSGSQGCDSFTRTWSICLCDSDSDSDAGLHGTKDGVRGIQPSPHGPKGLVSVGGARLTSPNYELLLMVPASPSSDWVESESYRLRLGFSAPKDEP